ncbi:MAG: glycine oxidase ThiO [Rhodothermales bacterium]
MQHPVVIVGAGVIGLSIGWKLCKAGVNTLILERQTAGQEASWASAGMLAPESELGFEEEALYQLSRGSLSRWPAFTKALEADSNASIDYRTEGILKVADDRDAAEALQRHYVFQKEQGLDVQWLTGAEAREIEPFLAPRLPAAVFSKSDHQVDNRLLTKALLAAFKNAGGKIEEQTPVQSILTDGEHPVVVTENGTRINADQVVLAAGAWSRKVEGFTPALRPPVRPVKGQMIQLQIQAPFDLQHVVWGRDAYLAPKSNGRLLLGATMEERGFDKSVTAGGLYDLLDAGWKMVPGIYDLEVTDTWAGLRPASRDNEPLLGQSSIPNIIFATGHYRNGIVLVPITAEEITRLIIKKETSEWLVPFSPMRFDPHTTTP